MKRHERNDMIDRIPHGEEAPEMEGSDKRRHEETLAHYSEARDTSGSTLAHLPLALGRVVGTPSALMSLELYGVEYAELLHRHRAGDWGEVCDEDARLNDRALIEGTRILSAYEINPCGASLKVWIITEADRSSTCVLLPNEY